jgi:ABC-type phosphate transport system auxiliary subunit
MSIMESLRREVKRTLLQGKLHHPLQSLSCQMMSQKRSQLKSKNKEVIQMTTQTLRTKIWKMEMLMISQLLRSGTWSSVTMMEGMHAFRPS